MEIIRLLTIGNSFANNAATYLDDLANSTGRVRFEIGHANLGGCSLEKHWNLSLYTERHPEHKTYRIGMNSDGIPHEVSLQEALNTAPWDYVTLQQVSHTTERVFSWPELDFDYQNAEAPSLPRQKHSLAVGLSTIVRKAYRRCNWIPITSTPTDATWLVVCGSSA